MFTGDIAKFSPPDLLMFLAHLGNEGVLTVTNADQGLQVSFKKGLIVDAHSEAADERLLRTLLFEHRIETHQCEYIKQARLETGLPVRRILQSIDSFDVAEITDLLESTAREVLFHLILWDAGQFNFAEIPLDADADLLALPCEKLTLDIIWQVDEYNEFLRSIGSLDRITIPGPPSGGQAEATPAQRFLLEQSTGKQSVRRVIEMAPFPALDLVLALRESIEQGWIALLPDGNGTGTQNPAPVDKVFASYKRSLRKIVAASDARPKAAEIVSFCKEHFTCSLVVAIQDGNVVGCRVYRRGENGERVNRDIGHVGVHTSVDPIFDWVRGSKQPFFGKVFESQLLDALGESGPDPGGDCAVVALGSIGGPELLVYVASNRAMTEPGPFQYLELMSWSLNPPTRAAPSESRCTSTEHPPSTASPMGAGERQSSSSGVEHLVKSIGELPPMPSILAQTLDLLSDPDAMLSDLADVLSHDPAMVARLIKVSNSALYNLGQDITSLDQAIGRLGTSTIRSIVVGTSARALFPTGQTDIDIWGQSLWKHSVECGLASKGVAKIVGNADPNEAFVGGILHDIGKVVILLNLPEEFRAIRKKKITHKERSLEAEMAVLGFDHTMVGERLVEQWKLPPSLRACVRHHHAPQEGAEFETLACIVACGNYFSHAQGAQPDEASAEQAIDMTVAQRILDLSDERIQSLHEEIDESFQHSSVLD